MIQRISEVLMSDNTVSNQMCHSGNEGMYILDKNRWEINCSLTNPPDGCTRPIRP
jgi:hypothetical protein